MSAIEPDLPDVSAHDPDHPHHPDIPTIGPLAGSWTWDITSERWWWSDEMYAIHGLRPREVVPTLDLLMSHKHLEDLDKCQRALATAVELGTRFSNYHRIVDAQWTERHVLTVGSGSTDDTGRVTALSGLMVDLTRTRRDGLQPAIRDALDGAFEHRSNTYKVKDVLMVEYGTDPDAAFDILRSVSNHGNLKVRDLAARLIGALPEEAPGHVESSRLTELLRADEPSPTSPTSPTPMTRELP